MLILSTSGSVSMAVAPVDPSESPPTVRCSLDIEERRGRKKWGRRGGRNGERMEGRDKKEVTEMGKRGKESQFIKAAWIVPISRPPAN